MISGITSSMSTGNQTGRRKLGLSDVCYSVPAEAAPDSKPQHFGDSNDVCIREQMESREVSLSHVGQRSFGVSKSNCRPRWNSNPHPPD